MNRRYAGPVILAEDVRAAAKRRTVRIYKSEIAKSIDLLTHKHVDGSALDSPRVGNAVSSDSTEDVDAAVIAEYAEFRDAQLRKRMRFALAPILDVAEDDRITLEDKAYVYNLDVTETFDDNALKPLARYIHRYLVFGALADWYAQFGMSLADYYGRQLDSIEEQISSILRGLSIVKVPLQPFGPAKKF